MINKWKRTLRWTSEFDNVNMIVDFVLVEVWKNFPTLALNKTYHHH